MRCEPSDVNANGGFGETMFTLREMSTRNKNMIKLFLSTPCYGGVCLDKYATSIIKLQLELMREGIQLYLDDRERIARPQSAQRFGRSLHTENGL